MKTTLFFGISSLVVGIAVGQWLTHREFAYENLPVAATPVAPSAGATSAAVKTPGSGAAKEPVAVVVNGEQFNFGTMDRYAHNSHVFTIRNDGGAPLTLIKGTTTCKCT